MYALMASPSALLTCTVGTKWLSEGSVWFGKSL